ncbi:Uncharacterised protein [Salmonella enterica]|uniref:Uncharacterized protein n=1 Tax=Salmonella enterica TaxID=28901 RepID=A0A7D8IZD2_SALER|nr:Uncharacterised protein [Salmonella enterica]
MRVTFFGCDFMPGNVTSAFMKPAPGMCQDCRRKSGGQLSGHTVRPRSMLEGLAVHTSLLEKYEEISQSAGKEESTADILRQRLITNTRQLREFHGVMCAVTEQTLTQLRQESAR